MGQFYRDQLIAKEFAVGDRDTHATVAEAILDEDGNVTGYSFRTAAAGTPINGTASYVIITAAEFALLVEGVKALPDSRLL